MKKKTVITAYVLVILIILFNLPCYVFGVDLPKPTSDFFVNDFANVMSSQSEQYIQKVAVELQEKTSAQAVVVTVNSLQGESLEGYALNLFREWGIGTAEDNNGVLILVAIDDRMSIIEVGYGLEGALPDGKTGRIHDEYMIPYFQNGDYSSGITHGFLAIVTEIYNEYGVDADLGGDEHYLGPQQNQDEGNGARQLIFIIIGGILLMLDWIFFKGRITRMLMIIAFSRRGGGFSGGGRGGGFSGGGGRSGGGGSSRRW